MEEWIKQEKVEEGRKETKYSHARISKQLLKNLMKNYSLNTSYSILRGSNHIYIVLNIGTEILTVPLSGVRT